MNSIITYVATTAVISLVFLIEDFVRPGKRKFKDYILFLSSVLAAESVFFNFGIFFYGAFNISVFFYRPDLILPIFYLIARKKWGNNEITEKSQTIQPPQVAPEISSDDIYKLKIANFVRNAAFLVVFGLAFWIMFVPNHKHQDLFGYIFIFTVIILIVALARVSKIKASFRTPEENARISHHNLRKIEIGIIILPFVCLLIVYTLFAIFSPNV